jgi:DCN1-like protein 1/2
MEISGVSSAYTDQSSYMSTVVLTREMGGKGDRETQQRARKALWTNSNSHCYISRTQNGLPVGANHKSHAAIAKSLIASLSTDSSLFKKVYRYAFVVGKEPSQKALSLENALIYWGMLFSCPGLEWKSESQDWLALWISFLNEKWTRSVNRDMWNMTLEFATKTMEDETLGFWSEDGAWPSVIDTFVAWCLPRGIGRAEKEADMDIDS